FRGACELAIVPPLCPLATSSHDFTQAARLIERGEAATSRWLREGGLERAREDPRWALLPHRHRDAAAVPARSVADLLLQVLPALLLVDRALGGEACLEPLQADLLARIHAVAVLALVDALERAVDLADQLAIAVAGAQLQRVLGLAGGALGFVADVADFVLEVLDRLLGFLDQVGTPLQQPLAEVLQHERIHVLLVGAGLVTLRDDRAAVLVGLVRHDLDLGLRCRRRRCGDAGHGDLAHRARTRRRGAGPGRRGLDRRLARGARSRLGDRARRLGRLRDRGLHRGLGRHLLRRRLLRGGLLRRD